MADSIFVLNGPNLNRLGKREPDIYGTETLGDIERRCMEWGDANGLSITFRQSNQEGILIDWIHEAADSAIGIVINPAAYTHTSVALHDAIKSIEIPVVEVHLSDVHARDSFRRYVRPPPE